MRLLICQANIYGSEAAGDGFYVCVLMSVLLDSGECLGVGSSPEGSHTTMGVGGFHGLSEVDSRHLSQ